MGEWLERYFWMRIPIRNDAERVWTNVDKPSRPLFIGLN